MQIHLKILLTDCYSHKQTLCQVKGKYISNSESNNKLHFCLAPTVLRNSFLAMSHATGLALLHNLNLLTQFVIPLWGSDISAV